MIRLVKKNKPRHTIAPSLISPGQTISELADQLGKELVLEGLVIEKLGKQKNVTCVSCEKSATKLCLDCAETYCNSCSSAHKAMSMSKDHLQHDLPQTAQGQQSAARSHQTPRQDAGGDSGSQSSAERLRDSKESPGSQSQENLERDFLNMEAELCQESVAKLKDAVAVVEANMAQLQEVKKKLEAQQQLLTTYVTRLAKPDDALLANARSMLPRLRFVRADCRPPQDAALNTMTKHINSLLHTNDVSGDVSFDPMTCIPRRLFMTRPDTEGDTHKDGPGISSVVATPEGRLVMTDHFNKQVKVTELTNPATTVLGVKLEATPYRLCLLRDGLVAVTSDKKCVFFVDVSGPPSVVSHVETSRRYWGVGSVTEDDTLVVSCVKDKEGPACVDVVSRSGAVLKTVIDGSSLAGLSWPHYVCVCDRDALISDFDSSGVFRVELDTGRVVKRLIHTDLKSPWQIAADQAGNCYIASTGSQSVLVATPSGQWRRLLHGPKHGDATRVKPVGVCVTSWGVLVTWDELFGYSVVAGYDLT
nr:hypothetical protein BaRGS_004711 [Batillaria attramentaria]